jgi:uncharacterized membrane protein YczE
MSEIGKWLRPALRVPKTSWSAGESNWKVSPKTLVVLVIGLWLFGSGEAALVAAGIGQSPWTVLAAGVSSQAGISIGWAYLWVSVFVLSLWFPLRQKPGLGTFLNIVVIATSLQIMIEIFPNPQRLELQVVQVLFGILLVGAGSGLYLTCNVGPGTRDGLMTGLNERTGVRVGRARTFIEVSALTVGWLLGGVVGIGTLLFALLVGQSAAIAFGLVERLSPEVKPLD